jgi:hypothetical protein
MAFVEGASATWWFSVSSKSTENLIWDVGGAREGDAVTITSQKQNPGSWGAVVAAYLRNSGNGEGGGGGSGSGEGDGGSGVGIMRASGIGLAVVAYGILFTLI